MSNYRTTCALFLVAAALVSAVPNASAADKLRAGKATADTWPYAALDIGVEEGIFAKYGLDVEITTLSGGARFQQALASNSIDVGVSGTAAMAQTAKGSPVIAVAATVGAPRGFSVVVAEDSPIKAVADLKGKTISFGTNGSFPDWLVHRLSIAEGWGKDGIKGVALGSVEGSISAVMAHQVDAMMTATEVGLQMEEQKRGRIVTEMGRYAPTIINQAAFARKNLVAENPDLVERFLRGLFATVAFMKHNREKTIELTTKIFNQSPAVMGKAYDFEISTMVDDGFFKPDGLEVLKDSFVELGMLKEKPSDDQILTKRFVPVMP
ncbi:MAG TPA: ABC transporter substrate-binding protein [Stellaceae bacterium]|nr:ABC transporter substrate-binding protein [Stellaceae bacterium]